MDDAKLNSGFDVSEDVFASVVGMVFAGACPNNVLNGPPFDGSVARVELPKMLPEVVEVASFCPNGLLGGLEGEADWLNSALEEEGALAG